jgi:predicted homoserine dehydrogenase-like protein
VIFYDDLKSLEIEKQSIRIGLVGAGFMGRGIVEVIEATPGMEVVAISDIKIERAAECFEEIHINNFQEVQDAERANRIQFPEQRLITSNYGLMPKIKKLDFVIEATGIPEIGAEVAYHSIMNKKHIGMLNVETDITVGHYLHNLAKKNGVIYTVCTGDEPAALKELYDFSRVLGFTIVACGKGKNNPLDLSSTPESLSEKADNIGLNPRILTEFVDGSKTMVEMGCLANATGLTIDKRNMHGPTANLEELVRLFCPRSRGGILGMDGVVDYVIGDVAPGVFMIVRHEGKLINETLKYLKIGGGPEYLLYRPYHLTNIEVPISVALGVLYHKPSLSTTSCPTTEVITIAKRDLSRGEIIDCIGGSTVYGGLEKAAGASEEGLLPFGLCEGAMLKHDIEKGNAIRLSQVKLEETFLLELRRIQDRLND